LASSAAAASTVPAAEVTVSELQNMRIITLDRQKALNALSLPMIHALRKHVQIIDHLENTACRLVVLRGEGRAFCAGGDVRVIAESGMVGRKNGLLPLEFFHDEYQVDYALAHLRRPLIALLDGIVMGGGVGLSIHAPFRVATENTVFAMPETAIGLFPDVGGSYFLPRLDGALGMYLALTGARLKGADAVYAGVATHYVPARRLKMLMTELKECSGRPV
jgi:3-hydroxyisobutyryl-CoA hydrolase